MDSLPTLKTHTSERCYQTFPPRKSPRCTLSLDIKNLPASLTLIHYGRQGLAAADVATQGVVTGLGRGTREAHRGLMLSSLCQQTHCLQQLFQCHSGTCTHPLGGQRVRWFPSATTQAGYPATPHILVPLKRQKIAFASYLSARRKPSGLAGKSAPGPGGVGGGSGCGTSRVPGAASGAQPGTTSSLGGSERTAPTVGLRLEHWNQGAQTGRLHLHSTQRGGLAVQGGPSPDVLPPLPPPSSRRPPHLSVPVPTAQGSAERGRDGWVPGFTGSGPWG